MRLVHCVILSLTLLVRADPARSQVLHRVEPGETLMDLALRYYGDPSLGDLIAAHNDLARGLAPGTELRLPSAARHTVARGESWSDLAARYWGDAKLGVVLARWCGSQPAAVPVLGTTLNVPALVTYRLKPGETLLSLARRFYRDPARVEVLIALNRIEDPKKLRAGRALRIPVVATAYSPVDPLDVASQTALEIASPMPPASISAPPGGVAASEQRHDVASGPGPADLGVTTELMGAVNAYLDGAFEDALARLEEQRTRVLASGTEPERILLLRYLIFSYVAFDRDDAACDAFAALRAIEQPPTLSPELVSPKIRDTLDRCDH